MGKEIERKFLVLSDAYKQLTEPVLIRQGFLCDDKFRIVRVRIKGDQASLTVKGISHGAVRTEFEYPIPLGDALEMLGHLCLRPVITKHRYAIHHGGLTWEVDEFFDENRGLVVAEVELDDENQTISKPEWIGEEVTHDARYFNANLVKHPYSKW